MERRILSIKAMDRIRNTMLRSQTQIVDIARKEARLKRDWAGHICRMPSELWCGPRQPRSGSPITPNRDVVAHVGDGEMIWTSFYRTNQMLTKIGINGNRLIIIK